MNPEKLAKMAAQVRTGGKGSVRRKKKAIHKTTTTDDKRLQNTLKRLGVNNIPAIEEVNLFKDNGTVIHFTNPKGARFHITPGLGPSSALRCCVLLASRATSLCGPAAGAKHQERQRPTKAHASRIAASKVGPPPPGPGVLPTPYLPLLCVRSSGLDCCQHVCREWPRREQE